MLLVSKQLIRKSDGRVRPVVVSQWFEQTAIQKGNATRQPFTPCLVSTVGCQIVIEQWLKNIIEKIVVRAIGTPIETPQEVLGSCSPSTALCDA
jgi:hypothetical protein